MKITDLYSKKETYKFIRRSLKYLVGAKIDKAKFELLWNRIDYDDFGQIELRELILIFKCMHRYIGVEDVKPFMHD